jgi:ribosomal protein S12 methylthiotransferase accessory factor
VNELIVLPGGEEAPPSVEDPHREQVQFFERASVDGVAAQEALQRAKVVVVGDGLVASHALGALADSGVGGLVVLGEARATPRDLSGNALLTRADVGRPRAGALAGRLRQRDPQVDCEGADVGLASAEELAGRLVGADCALVCLDSPDPSALDAVNQAALGGGVRWIAGLVDRGVGLVGPTVIPGESPCYKCYALRRDANLDDYEAAAKREARLRQMRAIKTELVGPRAMAACLGGLLALEAMRLITRLALPQMAGRVLRVDFFAPEMTYHRILRMPRCPACGYGKRRPVLPSEG